MDVVTGLQLPLWFDPVRLCEDLARVRAEEWTPHFNERDYGGDWTGAALRSPSGRAADLTAHAASFRDTELLERCSYFREVLACFHCSLKSVRLLSLAAGSFVREHCDGALGYEDGEVRIHIPVQTNREVEFYSAGERLLLREGECHYVNVSLPHRVNNRGGCDRIHLVIDAEVNDWMRDLFAGSAAGARIEPRPTGFDTFRHLVLKRPDLRESLQAASSRKDFIGTAVALGRENGFDFSPWEIETTFYGDVTGPLSREWVPTRVRREAARHVAEWVWFGSRQFTEPFFDDSVRAALRSPFAQTFRLRAPLPCSNAAPTGLIFHISRCGSTLVARMLGALFGSTVISEAEDVDRLIAARDVEGLRAFVAAARRGDGPCLLKLDCWHVHRLAFLETVFPETPWLFLYREPLEVLVSHRRSPGKQALPGAMDPARLGLEAAAVTLPRDEWCVRVLEQICRAALEFRAHPRGLFLNYSQLPEAVFEVVAPHFGLELSAGDRERMRECARMHAKIPSLPFEADAEEKQREAPGALRDLSAKRLAPLYRELEAVAASSQPV